jgi:hypothetical protein
MNVEIFLLKHGIRTYSYPVITEMQPKIEVQIGDSISTELGWIYGISTEVSGVTPKDKNVNLPTYLQAADLYLNLQNGQTWYINDLRYSNLVFLDPVNGIPINSKRYYDVNIPYTTDLKQSIIRNPKMLSGFSVMTTFQYIPLKTYKALVASGILKEDDLGIV